MENHDAILWDHKRWLEKSRKAKDKRVPAIAMDMVCAFTNGATYGFRFDPEAISTLVSGTAETVTPADVLGLKDKLLEFFVELPDGRWAASPELFSATDDAEGNNEKN